MFWWESRAWLQGSLFDYSNFRWEVFIFLILISSSLGVGLIIFRRYVYAIAFGLFVSIGYLVFFGPSPLNLIVSVLVLLFCLQSMADIKEELDQRTKINIKRALDRGSKPLLLMLFLLLSFGAYRSPAIEGFKGLNQLPTSSHEFIKTIVQATVQGQTQGASPTEVSLFINQATQQVMTQANSYVGPYLQYLPSLLAFGLFLTLWGLIWLFSWLSIGMGWLIFLLLKKIKFIRIEEGEVKAEVLVV